NPPESPRSNARILVAIHSGINSLIAFCADARVPRATSGQGRAYSAARDDMPDRTALSANNWRARCTISKPRRRDLTLRSKTAGSSKCSYRLSVHGFTCAYESPASLALVVFRGSLLICRKEHDVLAHGETRPGIAPP